MHPVLSNKAYINKLVKKKWWQVFIASSVWRLMVGHFLNLSNENSVQSLCNSQNSFTWSRNTFLGISQDYLLNFPSNAKSPAPNGLL